MKKSDARVKNFLSLTGEQHTAYKEYQKSLNKGALDLKTRELIMVAVGVAIRCSYCMEIHSKRARNAGVSDEELAHAIHLVASVRHGATISHGIDIFEEIETDGGK